MSLLDFLISPAAAQAAPAAGQQPSMIPTFVMLGLFFVLMYFMMIRPQMKRQKEHRAMLDKLQKGDEVVTTGGIAGRVENIGDNFISVEIAEGVRIKIQRGAISTVLPKGTLKAA
ncbi:preprotein translocase subunit YajC [Coralloluteibacterium stylophorae]|uniref:Sec translocon accessory complex subunit YajC n=1 Tax=Coralloluteibacterium stylophorae TaxID=1776034 RepID=A0A8J7VTI3_9GAMM|nr:preprotein translocase subunit YajC [Coralloluteibacterium stylophorae]MBS7456188.1 preprotein translocase subunit YajC [Coralloluteibacterium stylophorae]